MGFPALREVKNGFTNAASRHSTFFGQLCVERYRGTPRPRLYFAHIVQLRYTLWFVSAAMTLSKTALYWPWDDCCSYRRMWVISNRCVAHSSSFICLLLLGCTSTFIIIVLYLGKDLRHPLHPQLKKNTLKLISFAGIQLTDPLMDLSQAGNKKLAHVGPNAVSKNTSYDSFSQKLTRCFQCGRLPVWRSRILDFPKCLTNPNGNFFTWPGDRPWWCYVWSCPSHIFIHPTTLLGADILAIDRFTGSCSEYRILCLGNLYWMGHSDSRRKMAPCSYMSCPNAWTLLCVSPSTSRLFGWPMNLQTTKQVLQIFPVAKVWRTPHCSTYLSSEPPVQSCCQDHHESWVMSMPFLEQRPHTDKSGLRHQPLIFASFCSWASFEIVQFHMQPLAEWNLITSLNTWCILPRGIPINSRSRMTSASDRCHYVMPLVFHEPSLIYP